MDNQLMRRWPTTDERKRSAGFFHGIRANTYICTILKEKRLLPVYIEETNMQLFYEWISHIQHLFLSFAVGLRRMSK